MRSLLLLALGATALAACDQSPEKTGNRFEIGGTEVRIPFPDGYCRLDKDKPSDGRFLRITRRQVSRFGQLVVAIAPCDQLEAWRGGRQRTLNDYGYVLAPAKLVRRKFKFSRAYFVGQFAKTLGSPEFKARSQRMIDAARQRSDKEAPGIRIVDARILGVLRTNDDGVHVGITQKVVTEFGDTRRLAGTFGATLVRQKVIFVYLFGPYVSPHSVGTVLDAEEAWLKAIVAAND